MSREALVRETLRLPWSEVLAIAPVPTKVIVAKTPAELIGVVVPLRGRWWGLAVTRCDRAIALEIAESRGTGRYGDYDIAVRWLGLELAKAVRRTVDLTAELGDAIVLAGDETHWVPKNATLQAEACFRIGDRNLVVSAFERTRSDRRTPPTIASPLPRAVLSEPSTVEDLPSPRAGSRSRETA